MKKNNDNHSALRMFPTDKLEAEIKRRKQQLAEKKRQAVVKRQMKFAEALTIDIVNVLAPKHSDLCDDVHFSNGFSPYGSPRCSRCALLQILNGNGDEMEWNYLRVHLEWDSISSLE
jgi:hypothetical protein